MRLHSLSLLFLLTAPISLYSKQVYAQDNPFKTSTAFWLRGSSIHVLPNQEISLFFAIVDKKGKPYEGFSGTLAVSTGNKIKLTHTQNGIFEAKVPPMTLNSRQEITLTLEGNGIKKVWKDTWIPKPIGSITLKTKVSQIILSKKDTPVPLDITVTGPESDKAKLTFKTSFGNIKDVKSLGDGQYRALLIPSKKKRTPQIAIITVADKRNPQDTYGSLAIPVYKKIKLPITAPPKSSVRLEVAGKLTPLQKVGRKGIATFDLLVPPYTPKAKLIITAPEKREEEVDLNVPTQPRTLFIPTSKNIPSNEPQTLRFFALNNKGLPDTQMSINFTATLGTLSPPKHLENGLYEMEYMPPPIAKRTKVHIKQKGKKTKKLSFFIEALRPERMILHPEKTLLDGDDKESKLDVRIFGYRNTPLINRTLHVESKNATLKNVTEQGFGQYETTIKTAQEDFIPLITHIHDKPSKNPPTDFVIDAASLRFSPTSPAQPITITSIDQYGNPVKNTSFQIELIQGDVTLPKKGKTNKYGFAYIYLQPGQKEGVVDIKIYNNDITSRHTLFQLKETSTPSLYQLPISGNLQNRNIVTSWRDSISFVSLAREEVENKKTSKKLRPKKISIDFQPSKGLPGKRSSLNFSVQDKNKKGVEGLKLRAFSSLGKISSIKELGNGNYEAHLKIPKNIQSDISIAVEVSSTKVKASKTLPVAKGQQETRKFEAPKIIAKSPVKKKTSTKKVVKTEKRKPLPTKKKQKKVSKPITLPKLSLPSFSLSGNDSTNEPKVNISLGVISGQYSYLQDPFVTGSALFDKRVAFTNDVLGSAPATTVGINARARIAPLPEAFSKFLLFEAKYLAYNYAVALEEFPDPIRDWNSQLDLVVIPRYMTTIGDHRIHAGLRLGFGFDDFMIFQQSIDENLLDISYNSITLQNPSVGLDIAYANKSGLVFDGYVEAGISGGIYRNQAGLQLGYNLGGIQPEVGFRFSQRTITIEGSLKDLGEINDGLMLGYIGASKNF